MRNLDLCSVLTLLGSAKSKGTFTVPFVRLQCMILSGQRAVFVKNC
jgi:hypothetical protein